MLGVLDDVSKHLRAGFSRPGADAWLLGAALDQPASALGGSEYLEAEHGRVAGLPSVDLQAERSLQQLVLRLNAEGLLLSAHDCSDGGLAVTLAECAILGDIGFEGRVDVTGRLDAALFGEGQGRIVISTQPDSFRQGGGVGRIQDLARDLNVPVTRIGRTVAGSGFSFGPIFTDLTALRGAYESLLS
jgi:phosphoribosylformylglycinamidine synthase